MIFGLPLSAWLLLVLSTLPALVMVLLFFRAHARDDQPQPKR